MHNAVLFFLSYSLLLSCSSKEVNKIESLGSQKDPIIQEVTLPSDDYDTIETIKEKTLAEFLNAFEKFETKSVYEWNEGLHLIDELYQLVDFRPKCDDISIFRGELINDNRKIFFVNEKHSGRFALLLNNHDDIDIIESSYSEDYRLLYKHIVYQTKDKTYLGIGYGGTFTGETLSWIHYHDITQLNSKHCLTIGKVIYSDMIYCSDTISWREDGCQEWNTEIKIKNDSIFLKQRIETTEQKCIKYNTFSLLDTTLRNVTLNANCPN